MRKLRSDVIGVSKLISWSRSWGEVTFLEEKSFNNYNGLFATTELTFSLEDTGKQSKSKYSLWIDTKDINNIKVD
jgi:hypothetical protein